jgi:hypothetical protein
LKVKYVRELTTRLKVAQISLEFGVKPLPWSCEIPTSTNELKILIKIENINGIIHASHKNLHILLRVLASGI